MIFITMIFLMLKYTTRIRHHVLQRKENMLLRREMRRNEKTKNMKRKKEKQKLRKTQMMNQKTMKR